MNILRFNNIDLEANRQGELTDAQIKKLDADLDTLRQRNKGVVISIAVLCIFRSIFETLTRYDKVGHDLGRLFSGENLGTILIPLVLLVLMTSIVIPFNWWATRRFARSAVHTVEGHVRVIYREKRFLRGAVYNVKIWRGWFWWMLFRFDDAESLAYFESGKRYRIYYLALFDRPQALSCEEILDEKAKR